MPLLLQQADFLLRLPCLIGIEGGVDIQFRYQMSNRVSHRIWCRELGGVSPGQHWRFHYIMAFSTPSSQLPTQINTPIYLQSIQS